MRSIFLAVPAILIAAAPLSAQTFDRTLFFALGSATLTADHQRLLDEATEEYRRTGSASVSIVGHTDTVASAEFNERLSQRRATAVSEALTRRGVPASSISSAWRGENDLAVQTGDNVPEQANRRVEVSIADTSVTPAPVAAVAPMPEEEDRFRVIIAPFGAWNIEPGDNSAFLGLNLTASYDITPNLVASVEQAGFYSVGSDDEGFGGRSAAGLDLQIDTLGSFLPYVGVNTGYTYVEGSATGGFFAGPEVGLRFGGFEAKVAYDIYIDEDGRDIDDGVLAVTLGYGLRF